MRYLIVGAAVVLAAACAPRNYEPEVSPEILRAQQQARQDLAQFERQLDSIRQARMGIEGRITTLAEAPVPAAPVVVATETPASPGDTAARTERTEAGDVALGTAAGTPRLSADDMRIVESRVYFPTNSSTLNAEARRALDQKLEILRENEAVTLRIVGHADARGAAAYNLKLSERRADAVRRYLTSKGIAASRVETLARGEEEPAVEGDTPDAYRENRRVEFVIE